MFVTNLLLAATSFTAGPYDLSSCDRTVAVEAPKPCSSPSCGYTVSGVKNGNSLVPTPDPISGAEVAGGARKGGRGGAEVAGNGRRGGRGGMDVAGGLRKGGRGGVEVAGGVRRGGGKGGVTIPVVAVEAVKPS